MRELDANACIAVAGAGSVGGHVGGCLALAGRHVTLLARAHLSEAVNRQGLLVGDLGGGQRRLDHGAIGASTDPAQALFDAALVLVTVKSGDTETIGRQIATHAPTDAIVVSLQNGVSNPDHLRALVGPRRVVAGMVPFNVVQDRAVGAPLFRRTTSGGVLVEAGVPGLRGLLDVEGLSVEEHGAMPAVLWGKLLLNLNNALNGLSGLPLAAQLADRRWRRVLAMQIGEALAAMKAAGIRPARIGALRPSLLPFLLRLPDGVFRVLARRMLTVDAEARSSTYDDLERRRATEIDAFQGEIARLAEATGTQAPLTAAILSAVRDAEAAGRGSPRLPPETFDALLR
ncbi:MAG: 2-dehydropantoate 2-reductase [Rhizobiaceae bacterium]